MLRSIIFGVAALTAAGAALAHDHDGWERGGYAHRHWREDHDHGWRWPEYREYRVARYGVPARVVYAEPRGYRWVPADAYGYGYGAAQVAVPAYPSVGVNLYIPLR